MRARVGVPVVFIIWVVIGIIVAIDHGYGHGGPNGLSRAVSFIAAAVLWPFVAWADAKFHIHVTIN
jgi:hypothetical protein